MQQDDLTPQTKRQTKRHGPMPIMMHLALMALNPDKVKDILQGLHNYHHHPYFRDNELAPLQPVWNSGSVQLLHAKANNEAQQKAPTLLIPSFINGSEILDLTKERSFVRWLVNKGHDCYLLDWGNLTEDECGSTFSNLVTKRLAPALQFVTEATKQKPSLIGYCLGGNFACALAALNRGKISKLVLLAAPWDFHHPDNMLKDLLLAQKKTLKDRSREDKALTTEYLQSLFIQTDLKQSAKKYANFGKNDPSSEIAKHFVATEDWVNGGQPIPAKLIQDIVTLFYKDNVTMKNNWALADGTAINVQDITAPALVMAPIKDNIVPYATSSAIRPFLSNAQLIDINTGHIGMLVGSKAKEISWQPILDFLN